MTNEELLKEITSMPEEDKRIVERLIAKIRKRLSGTVPQPDNKKTSFRDEPFFGMWADREDMKEGGAAWVRKIRKEQWDRSDRWS
ncbi:MAG: hypothetical protein H0X08_02580 [Blastocatellia bacterium]|nr:hypothetical protein [Blastocatellia bacterium]